MKARHVLLVIGCLGSMRLARAVCSQPQPRSVCAEYSASKIVAEATLLKIDNVLYKHDPEAVTASYYTLRVDRVFRGTPGQTVRIYEGNDSGRASFDWRVGRKYVLFLFDSIEKASEKVLEFDGCGNSGPVAHANSVLREIEQMNDQRRTAFITGMVSAFSLDGAMPNIEMVARGGGASYKGRTNRQGRFTIEVPPGDYEVIPVNRQLSFEISDLSYEDPLHLAMQPGSCAQVQFVETLSGTKGSYLSGKRR
jgi:hypothetical protein